MTASVTFTNTSNWDEAIYVFKPGSGIKSAVEERDAEGVREDGSPIYPECSVVAKIFRGYSEEMREVGEVSFYTDKSKGFGVFECDLFRAYTRFETEYCDPVSRDFIVREGEEVKVLDKAVAFCRMAASCERVKRLERKESVKMIGADEEFKVWAEPVPRGEGEYLGEVKVIAEESDE